MYLREFIYRSVGCNPLDCVWLSSAAKLNQTQSDGFSSVLFDFFGNQTCAKFGVWFGSIAELDWTQSMDWVWFPNIRLTMPDVFLGVATKTASGEWETVNGKLISFYINFLQCEVMFFSGDNRNPSFIFWNVLGWNERIWYYWSQMSFENGFFQAFCMHCWFHSHDSKKVITWW